MLGQVARARMQRAIFSKGVIVTPPGETFDFSGRPLVKLSVSFCLFLVFRAIVILNPNDNLGRDQHIGTTDHRAIHCPALSVEAPLHKRDALGGRPARQ